MTNAAHTQPRGVGASLQLIKGVEVEALMMRGMIAR